MFGWFKKKIAPPPDPLAAFDGAIESLERQGREVRKSAATLLSLKRDLERELERSARRREEVAQRLGAAGDDARAVHVLQGDWAGLDKADAATREALARAEADAGLLAEAAHGLTGQLESLRQERQGARARLASGLVVSEALQARAQQFDRVLALDRARDEVERAHALAEVYRDDATRR